jgi:hypothetical protein
MADVMMAESMAAKKMARHKAMRIRVTSIVVWAGASGASGMSNTLGASCESAGLVAVSTKSVTAGDDEGLISFSADADDVL